MKERMAVFFALCLGLSVSYASACLPIHSGFYVKDMLYLTHGPHGVALPGGVKEANFDTLSSLIGFPHVPNAALSCSTCGVDDPAILFNGSSYYKYAEGVPLEGPFSTELIHPSLRGGVDAVARRNGYAHYFKGCNYYAVPSPGLGEPVVGDLPSIGLPCDLDAAWENGPDTVVVRGPEAFLWPRNALLAQPYPLYDTVQIASRPLCPTQNKDVYVVVNNIIEAQPSVEVGKPKKTTETTTTTTTTTTTKPTTTTLAPTEPPTTTTTTTTLAPTTPPTTTTTPEPTTTTSAPEPTTTTTTTTTTEVSPGGEYGHGKHSTGRQIVGGKKIRKYELLKKHIQGRFHYKKIWSTTRGGTLVCSFKEYRDNKLTYTGTKNFHYDHNDKVDIDEVKQKCKDYFKNVVAKHPENSGAFYFMVKPIDGKRYLLAFYKEYKDNVEIRYETKMYELLEGTEDEEEEYKAEFRRYIGFEHVVVEDVGPQGRVSWTKSSRNGKGTLTVKFHELQGGKEVGVEEKTFKLEEDSGEVVQDLISQFLHELGVVKSDNPTFKHKHHKVISTVDWKRKWDKGVKKLFLTYRAVVDGDHVAHRNAVFELEDDSQEKIDQIITEYKAKEDRILEEY